MNLELNLSRSRSSLLTRTDWMANKGIIRLVSGKGGNQMKRNCQFITFVRRNMNFNDFRFNRDNTQQWNG